MALMSPCHGEQQSHPVSLPSGIESVLAAEGGRVTFARFMELALLHPTEGYYSRVGRLLGPRGDFSTVPLLSPTFNRAVARLVSELIDASISDGSSGGVWTSSGPSQSGGSSYSDDLRHGDRCSHADRVSSASIGVVELGGGEGDLATALVDWWERHSPELRQRITYSVVEIGADLRRRQQEVLAPAVDRGWRFLWASDLDGACTQVAPAVVLGNEFVDALPVHLVDVRGERPLEAWVCLGDSRSGGGGASITEAWEELSREASDELLLLFGTTDPERLRSMTRDGTIELRPSAGLLTKRAARCLGSGCLLTIDYGEWFGPARVDQACCRVPWGAPQSLDLVQDRRVRAESSAEEDVGRRETDSESCSGTGGLAGTSQGGSAFDAGCETENQAAASGVYIGSSSAKPYGRSLRGYFRHQTVLDPYQRIGLQDLTADVDFRALDLHGREDGFETVLFVDVATLLRANGGEEELATLRAAALQPSASSLEADREASMLEALLDGEGLGRAFKVMLQVRESR